MWYQSMCWRIHRFSFNGDFEPWMIFEIIVDCMHHKNALFPLHDEMINDVFKVILNALRLLNIMLLMNELNDDNQLLHLWIIVCHLIDSMCVIGSIWMLLGSNMIISLQVSIPVFWIYLFNCYLLETIQYEMHCTI